MMLEADAVLPIALSRDLLQALCPLPPAAPVAARVRERVMARIRGGARGAPVPRAVLAVVDAAVPAVVERTAPAAVGCAVPAAPAQGPAAPGALSTGCAKRAEPIAAPVPATAAGSVAPRVSRAQEGWTPLAADADMKILCDDGSALTWLLRLAPGGRLPDHTHDEGDEECLLLDGDIHVNGVRYLRGDWQLARLGSRHRDVYSEHGCVLYLRSRVTGGTCRLGPRATNGGHCHA